MTRANRPYFPTAPFNNPAWESIKTTVCTTRLLWPGAIVRMLDDRLPTRVMTNGIDGTVKRGRSAKEKD